jgi:hypothetical protein
MSLAHAEDVVNVAGQTGGIPVQMDARYIIKKDLTNVRK